MEMGYFYLLTTIDSFIMKVDYRCLFNSLTSFTYLIRKSVAGLYGSSSVSFEALGHVLYYGCAGLHLWTGVQDFPLDIHTSICYAQFFFTVVCFSEWNDMHCDWFTSPDNSRCWALLMHLVVVFSALLTILFRSLTHSLIKLFLYYWCFWVLQILDSNSLSKCMTNIFLFFFPIVTIFFVLFWEIPLLGWFSALCHLICLFFSLIPVLKGFSLKNKPFPILVSEAFPLHF